jgi:hypothetical protein
MTKSVMKQIIGRFSKSPLSRWKIAHKRLWMEFLDTGDIPFSPRELHTVIQEIVNMPENRPRGDKLMHLRKRNAFTLKANKIPYRPEEALERFVVVSNEENFYNQTPVGGGKESIDLVIEHNKNSIEFIELKPWNSNNSPIYALVEGLKNLIEYRVIHEQEIRDVKDYAEVALSLLAPEEYYQKYFLLDTLKKERAENLYRSSELLYAMASEFNAKITFKSCPLTPSSFQQKCSRIYDEQGLSGQQVATVTEHDAIASLRLSNWLELATSDTTSR